MGQGHESRSLRPRLISADRSDNREVDLVDLPVVSQRVTLRVRTRWRCSRFRCGIGSWTHPAWRPANAPGGVYHPRNPRRSISVSIVTAKSIAAVAASDLGWVGCIGAARGGAVGGRHVHVDHLHGGELLQHRRRRQSGRQRAQMLLECDLQAIGDEGDEDEDVRSQLFWGGLSLRVLPALDRCADRAGARHPSRSSDTSTTI